MTEIEEGLARRERATSADFLVKTFERGGVEVREYFVADWEPGVFELIWEVDPKLPVVHFSCGMSPTPTLLDLCRKRLAEAFDKEDWTRTRDEGVGS